MTVWQSLLAALRAGTWVSAVPTVLSLAVTIGVLTSTQETAIQAAAGGLATLITLVFAAVHTAKKAAALRAAHR